VNIYAKCISGALFALVVLPGRSRTWSEAETVPKPPVFRKKFMRVPPKQPHVLENLYPEVARQMFTVEDGFVVDPEDSEELHSECGHVPKAPSPEETAVRAHHYWQERMRTGDVDGNADEDWLRAERDLDIEKF
jgi:Protein of unknown function (DUF2934)